MLFSGYTAHTTTHNASCIDRCWGHVLGLQRQITTCLATDTIHCTRITKYHKFIMIYDAIRNILSCLPQLCYRMPTFHRQEYFTNRLHVGSEAYTNARTPCRLSANVAKLVSSPIERAHSTWERCCVPFLKIMRSKSD